MPDREPFSEQDAEALANLTAVRLVSFDATPAEILPFGQSTIRWEVDRVGPSVAIELDGAIVASEGERTVAPTFTRTYVLRALSGRLVRALGQVTVSVDVDSCTTVRVFRFAQYVEDALLVAVNDVCDPDRPDFDANNPDPTCTPEELMDKDDGAYLKLRDRWVRQGNLLVRDGQMQPIVEVTDAGVNFQLALTVVVEGGPDIGLDINVGFGIELTDGTLVATYQRLEADASFPGWVWLVPGAMIAGPLALGSVEDKAREQIKTAIDAAVSRIAAQTSRPGTAFHSVQFISEQQVNQGALDITSCPRSPSAFGRPDLVRR